MARKKKQKKFAGEINFFKAMTVLGALLAGGLVYAFLGSAPDLSDHPFHVASDPVSECMTCHVVKTQSAPIMPHRPMDFCTFCHTPQADQL